MKKLKQKVQSKLVGKVTQKKQELTRKVKQIKTQTGAKAMQKKDFPAKATKTASYLKRVPFDDAAISSRLRKLTGGNQLNKKPVKNTNYSNDLYSA